MNFFATIIARLSTSTRGALARALAFIVFYIFRIRRTHVISSMERAGWSPGDAKQYAYCMYLELATSIMELALVASRKWAAHDFVEMDEDATARIRAARREGNVVLLCAHVSNWELVAMNAAEKFPLALVARDLSPRFVDAFMKKTRADGGVRVVAPKGALKEASLAHARGEVVATVIDQVPASTLHADHACFLGQNAFVDRAPAVMCKRARAHVFVMLAAREGSRVHVAIADEMPRDVVAKESAREIMRRATVALDAHVRLHPASWLWMHRRWKSRDEIEALAKLRPARTARARSFKGPEKAVSDSPA